MDIFLSLIVAILFIVSFVGLLFPIIPSTLFIWGGFLLYYFFINDQSLTTIFWVIMGLFTVILFVSDVWLSSHFVKRFGGSKRGSMRLLSLYLLAPLLFRRLELLFCRFW